MLLLAGWLSAHGTAVHAKKHSSCCTESANSAFDERGKAVEQTRQTRALRRVVRDLFLSGLRAVAADQAVIRSLRLEGRTLRVGLRRWTLPGDGRVWIVGAGKASGAMASAAELALREVVAGGWVNVKDGHLAPTERVKLHEASHPLPDERGLFGAGEILKIARQARPQDLLLCLFSGGGSALLPAPVEGVSLEDKQRVTELLLRSGATIDEMNCVRKHLSRVKGGQLARVAWPTPVVSLLISDVLGDRLDVIASGPTAPDPTTFGEALAVLDKYGLTQELQTTPLLQHLRLGARGEIPDTPKPGDPIFEAVQNEIVASNALAVKAVEKLAGKEGFNTVVLTSQLRGEAKEVGRVLASVAWEIVRHGRPVRPPACVISGGETTVRLGKTPGKGGRNQELALAAALELPPLPGVVLLSAGTDGTDGPTDAAGAVVDGLTVKRARAKGLEPAHFLADHDSYRFFQKTGELLITGPTGTNVMDLQILLVEETS